MTLLNVDLEIPPGHVEGEHVASDILHGILTLDPFAAGPDDDAKLDLVVDLRAA